ncbi:MAG: acetyl-CoA carboxylase biotin carboxylase subunit [Solirubrobacteraceae bacterium]|nr:acetyl-CoA carboxylase biotin carboxylase subunit [Solirubrobacteraceae bacterium]
MAAGFDTLLVANRGEIACRVIRSARAMGLRTVAVYSEADAGAPHVELADTAVQIGPAPAAESYLDGEKIIEAARKTGAEAIHPGYGFLSENAAFAQACADAGITFVGPSPEAIAAMGDKAAAKRMMEAAGVPTVPGYSGEEQDDAVLIEKARETGFPLMVKAAAGGGGKGMRLVEDEGSLPSAIEAARREAAGAFGDETLLLERAVVAPRHVEIQVLADREGHTIHLGERDCSVQRRHQKVIEEAPSPAVDAELRERMGAAGVAAAEAVGYEGAGTVEFLLDAEGSFYFLEMNTRLQVEHPVTELVTGLDLVEWQLRIAAGEPLTIGQDDVEISGHAIEARLYAEDPENDYLPSTGRLELWATPGPELVRVDSGVRTGSEITPFYDPMVAKLACAGADRDEARARLVRALELTDALGPATNRSLLVAVLRSPQFAGGEATTAFLDGFDAGAQATPAMVAAVVAWLYRRRRELAGERAPGLEGWSSAGALSWSTRVAAGDQEYAVSVTEGRNGVAVRLGDERFTVDPDAPSPVVDGVEIPVRCLAVGAARVLAAFEGLDLELVDLCALPPDAVGAAGEGVLLAPMHGRVISVDAEVGASVSAGQRLVVLEAMKMEHEILADVDGVVEEIAASGSQVGADQVLARIAAA